MRSEKRTEVLLVEDHVVSLSKDFERAGFVVTEKRSVAAALKELRTRNFDVVVGDLRLAGKDGLALLRQMKEHSLDTPTFLIFDELDNATALAASALGALQCLVSPLDLEALKRMRDGLPSVSVKSTRFRSRIRGEVIASSVSATDAKSEFGKVLDTALQSGAVVITRHQSPKAVLLAMDEFESLLGNGARRLDTLSAEFDEMFDRMQAPGFNSKMRAAFGASPAEMGKAAVAAAKRRG